MTEKLPVAPGVMRIQETRVLSLELAKSWLGVSQDSVEKKSQADSSLKSWSSVDIILENISLESNPEY